MQVTTNTQNFAAELDMQVANGTVSNLDRHGNEIITPAVLIGADYHDLAAYEFMVAYVVKGTELHLHSNSSCVAGYDLPAVLNSQSQLCELIADLQYA